LYTSDIVFSRRVLCYDFAMEIIVNNVNITERGVGVEGVARGEEETVGVGEREREG
jgi:hypothetical protein